MKFQNPSFKFFFERTDGQTDERTDKPKEICSHFFKVGGIISDTYCIPIFAIPYCYPFKNLVLVLMLSKAWRNSQSMAV